MKKNIKKIFLLSVILLAISSSFILLMGKTYTTSFIISSDNYKLNLENDTGEVLIIEEKIKDNKYMVKIKSIKPGRVYLSLVSDQFTEQKYFMFIKL